VASDGTQANGPSVTGFGPYITLSGDGRYLAFYSEASNLVAGDSNGLGDFFILDQVTGTLERVPANNIYGVNGPTHSTISADGHCLAFASYADDLVPGDTNGKGDIFVYDRIAGTTERIQANLTPGFDAASPVMSADGNFVAFSSFSPDLGFVDTNGQANIFVFNRATQTTERMLAPGGLQPNHSSQVMPMSADGRFVAIESAASNLLITGDTNGATNVFVFDRQTSQIERVSIDNDGVQGNSNSHPSMSADGRFVAFNSLASNLVPNDTNGQMDVFLYDRLTDTIERVSVASDGSQALGGESAGASISADGRYVAYYSLASNLVAGDTNGTYDAFVFDRQTLTTTRVSVAEDGTQGNGMSVRSVMSPNGEYVAFDSVASNLVANDTNNVSDIFLADWHLL
jgi:Tol biopolymer transport system component